MPKFTLTSKVYGEVTMLPGEVVTLTEAQANSDFWRSRVTAGVPTVAQDDDEVDAPAAADAPRLPTKGR